MIENINNNFNLKEIAISIQLKLKIEDKARISLKDFLFIRKIDPVKNDKVKKGKSTFLD